MPKINHVGEDGYHVEDEDGKNFTLQKRLDQYHKYIDLFTAFNYKEKHVRLQPGFHNCFVCGAFHRRQDWMSRKGEHFQGTACAEVARISGKAEEPELGKRFRQMWREKKAETEAFAGHEEEKDSEPKTKEHLMRAEINHLRETLS